MLQGFTWCAPNTPYTSLFSVPVHRTISPGLFGPVHQIRLAAPFTSTVLRPRFQLCSPSPSPQPFSILVPGTILHPRHRRRPLSSSQEPFSVLRSSFPKSSSVHVFSSVHHPRHLNHPPSSSPKPSFILVFSPVHRILLRNRSPSPYTSPSSILVTVAVLHPRFQPPCFFGCN